MEFNQDYFFCDECENKDFKRIYNFSIQLHRVNFSDNLIYDEITDKRYQCTKCQKIFSMMEIEEGLDAYKRRRKEGGI